MNRTSRSQPTSSLRAIDGSELPSNFPDIGFFDVDRRVFRAEYETLTASELGSTILSRAWYVRNPSIYSILLCGDEVVGYCNFMPLEEVAYQQILAGELADGEISPDMVRSFDSPGPYKVFCCGIAVVEEYRRGGIGLRVLLREVWKKWVSLADCGCYLSDLAGVAWSNDGRALCEGLQLQRIRRHESYGETMGYG